MNQPHLECPSEHFGLEVIAQWNVNCHYVIVKTRRFFQRMQKVTTSAMNTSDPFEKSRIALI